jgi:hypothetical protein
MRKLTTLVAEVVGESALLWELVGRHKSVYCTSEIVRCVEFWLLCQ